MPITNQVAADLLTTFVQSVDAGSGAGKCKIYTAGYGVLLAEFTLNDPAFTSPSVASPSVSTLDLTGSITTTGLADGTAGAFQFTDSDDVAKWQETGASAVGTAGSVGGDDPLLVVNTTDVFQFQTLEIESMSVSFPTAFANLP
jgi:hypothetical protein